MLTTDGGARAIGILSAYLLYEIAQISHYGLGHDENGLLCTCKLKRFKQTLLQSPLVNDIRSWNVALHLCALQNVFQ